MFGPYAQGESLALQGPALRSEIAVDVAGRMARGQDDGAGLVAGTAFAADTPRPMQAVTERPEALYFLSEMIFAAMLDDALAANIISERK